MKNAESQNVFWKSLMSGEKRGENGIFQPLWFSWNPSCLNSWERSTEDLLIPVSEFSAQTFILRLSLVYKLPAADGTWQIFYAPVIMSFCREVLTCGERIRTFQSDFITVILKHWSLSASHQNQPSTSADDQSLRFSRCVEKKINWGRKFLQLFSAWSEICKGWNGALLFSWSWLLTF